jgi:S-adenosyl-L-methionine hydrolase (adenosine-forming)
MTRLITFLSDYGLADEFVGVVHGVIARACPGAQVIDISHGVPRHGVLQGALVLARALPYTPPGVHLAVVDPEVGARRRAVALRTAEEDRLLVGPDNGLLMLAAEHFGGCLEAVEISHSKWRLEPVSATFHGRDVFAPVAAQLAAGADLALAGEPMDPDDLVTLGRTRARQQADGSVVAEVVACDAFGNVQLDLTHDQLPDSGLRLGRPLRLEIGGRAIDAIFARAFADVAPGEVLLYEDASRTLAIAINTGDAAEDLLLRTGDEVRIVPCPDGS